MGKVSGKVSPRLMEIEEAIKEWQKRQDQFYKFPYGVGDPLRPNQTIQFDVQKEVEELKRRIERLEQTSHSGITYGK